MPKGGGGDAFVTPTETNVHGDALCLMATGPSLLQLGGSILVPPQPPFGTVGSSYAGDAVMEKKFRVSNTPYDGGWWVTDGGWWVTDGGWRVTAGGNMQT